MWVEFDYYGNHYRIRVEHKKGWKTWIGKVISDFSYTEYKPYAIRIEQRIDKYNAYSYRKTYKKIYKKNITIYDNVFVTENNLLICVRNLKQQDDKMFTSILIQTGFTTLEKMNRDSRIAEV